MLEEAWQSVENHDQSIKNMTKGRHEESSLFFLERLPTLVRSKIFGMSMGLHFEY